MKHILGISAGFHDAAATVIRSDGEIVFAGHSERYSKNKNDSALATGLLSELCEWKYDTVAFYERPWMHNLQQWYSGQAHTEPWTTHSALKKHLGTWYQNSARREVSYPHHLSHAAAGFQTSPYDRATVVVIDAIGELDTISIYGAEYVNGVAKYKRLWRQRYPHSIGLFYSAVTDRVGLRPMDEEYITMGMSAYGKHGNVYAIPMKEQLIDDVDTVTFKQNFHAGFDEDFMYNVEDADIASAGQHLVEELIYSVMKRAQNFGWSRNLVYMGGVALNCLANRNLGEYFENNWIMPNPGDAGSSLGSAALAYGGRINWRNPYLGFDIPGAYPVDNIVNELLTKSIVGVASGRAEFGPRALGNRSLLADPRGSTIKERVNEIKRRQQFRPFAPVILEECVNDYFDMPQGYTISPYMQVVARCRHPDHFPAIIHVDGTSRVQTVSKDCGSGIRQLLERWYVETGCPMLLNTSLNIRGEPMVNDRADADRFEREYGVKVCS
jgi:carbamoyltransferase